MTREAGMVFLRGVDTPMHTMGQAKIEVGVTFWGRIFHCIIVVWKKEMVGTSVSSNIGMGNKKFCLLFPRSNARYDKFQAFFRWLCKFVLKSYILCIHPDAINPSVDWILKSLNLNTGNTNLLLFSNFIYVFNQMDNNKE